MRRLGVNIDHVASLRELRQGFEPEPLSAAMICEQAGADSIVVHLREDRRHIKEKDLVLLKKAIKTKLNLEMSVFNDIVRIACRVRPDRATLVPERRQELTTEGGLDVVSNFKKISRVVRRLKDRGVEVSLFIDPDKEQVDASCRLGAGMVELHTGKYANSKNFKQRKKYLRQIEKISSYARSQGLKVFAGHGLDYRNVPAIAAIDTIEEFNIGYSIICRAVFTGLGRAVREMKALIG